MAQLQTGTQILNQTIPDRVIFGEHNYSSTSDAVLNRRHIEIAPLNDVPKVVSPNGESFTFEIASNTSMIDFRNSYIRMDLNIEYAGDKVKHAPPVLEINGVHGLIDNMEFRVASTQTTINREEGYNFRTALQQRKGFGRRDALESKRGVLALSGSGVQDGKMFGKPFQLLCSADAYNINVVDGGGTVTLETKTDDGNKAIDFPYEVGDYFAYSDAGTYQNRVFGTIIKVDRSTNNQVILTLVGDAGVGANTVAVGGEFTNPHVNAFTADNAVGDQIIVKKAPGDLGASEYYGSFDQDESAKAVGFTKGVTTTVCWKPDLGIMKTDKLFPLFLLSRGFQLIGKFDSNAIYHAFTHMYAYSTADNTPAITKVSVANMRYCAVMYDMHSVINQQYLDLYANRGLLFPFVQYNYQARQISEGEGESTVDMMVGQRSVRHGIARVTTDVLTGTTKTAQVNPSLSSAYGLGLDTYQWSSGSLYFPLRPVDVKRKQFFAYDNEEHMKIMLRQNKTRYDMHSLDIEPWNAPAGCHDRYGDVVAKPRIILHDDATHKHEIVVDKDGIILSGVFAREEEGLFAGLDTSVQPLRLTCNFGVKLEKIGNYRLGTTSVESTGADAVLSIGAKRLLQLWIASDTYLHISEASGVSRLS